MENSFKSLENSKLTRRNIGIEILRVLLSFWIILLHCYNSKNSTLLLLKQKKFHVPCFFFISFYFLFPLVSKRSISKFKLRIKKLLIPFYIFPIVIWFVNNVLFCIFHWNRFNRFLTLYELRNQLIIGRGIFGIGVLWFQFNLIIFTIIFFIMSFLFKSNFLAIFHIICIICYYLQYSGINYLFFCNYSQTITYTLGNIIETLPIAIEAFTFESIKIIERLKNHHKASKFFSFFGILFLIRYQIFTEPNGFSSKGVIYLFSSLLLFITFSSININIKNNYANRIIRQITSYTQGIYCLHFILYLNLKIIINIKDTFSTCFLLYFTTYFISFIGFKITEKTSLKYLFI